jgi:hypothetical protein
MVKKIFWMIIVIGLSSGIVYSQIGDNAVDPFIGEWIMQKETSIHHVYSSGKITVYMDGNVMWSARYVYDDEKVTFKRQSRTPYGIQEYDQVCQYSFSENKLELALEGFGNFTKELNE